MRAFLLIAVTFVTSASFAVYDISSSSVSTYLSEGKVIEAQQELDQEISQASSSTDLFQSKQDELFITLWKCNYDQALSELQSLSSVAANRTVYNNTRLKTAAILLENGQYEKAKTILTAIQSEDSGTNASQMASKQALMIDNVLMPMSKSNIQSAQSGVSDLISQFSQDPQLPEVLLQIAQNYEIANCFEEAKEVYGKISSDYSSSSSASNAQISVARLTLMQSIQNGDVDIEQQVSTFKTQYAIHSDVAEAIYLIANHCRSKKVKQHHTAKRLMEQFVQDYPDSPYAWKAVHHIESEKIMVEWKTLTFSELQTRINTLVSQFAEHPNNAISIYQFANQFKSYQDRYKADQLFQKIVSDYPNHPIAHRAQFKLKRNEIIPDFQFLDEQTKLAIINELKTNYSDVPMLPPLLVTIAQRYENNNDYENAQSLQKYVIENYPHTAAAQRIKMNKDQQKILVKVKSQTTPADLSVAKEFLTFHAQLPGTLDKFLLVAWEYEWAGKFEEAQKLYHQIMEQYPNHPDLQKVQMSLEINQKLLESWQSLSLDELQTQLYQIDGKYYGTLGLSDALYATGRKVADHGGYEYAQKIYQHILTDHSDSSVASKAMIDRGRCEIQKAVDNEQFQAANSQKNQWISQYATQPDFAPSFSLLAEGYLKKSYQSNTYVIRQACLDEALLIWEQIINEYSTAQVNWRDIYYWLGICYQQKNNYSQSNIYFEKILTEFSGHSQNDVILHQTSKNYEDMIQLEQISKTEGQNKIKELYQQLVDEYASSSLSKIALRWLNTHQN